MKKIILIVFVAMATFLMMSCNEFKSQRRLVEEMQCPVVVLAKSDESYNARFDNIVLQGSNGDIVQLSCREDFASALYDTFEVGDTIIHCK